MSDILVNLVAERFEAYATPFLSQPGETFAYRLKIAHTKRVTAFAETIAQKQALPERIALACRLAGLMHDVGRFEQYKTYHTFRDADSANHAALSVKHALREKLLDGLSTDIKRLVLGAVYLHNKRTLPKGLPPDLGTVARVVRDSDKLDIYGVMIRHFAQPNPEHPEVALEVTFDPQAYSPAIIEALLRREPGNYKDIVYANDFMLLVVGWLYDLNFDSSCRLLKESGHIDTLFEMLPKTPALLSFRDQITTDLAQRLRGA